MQLLTPVLDAYGIEVANFLLENLCCFSQSTSTQFFAWIWAAAIFLSIEKLWRYAPSIFFQSLKICRHSDQPWVAYSLPILAELHEIYTACNTLFRNTM
jgi:hypothetical protein